MEFGARHPSRFLTITNEALVKDSRQTFSDIFGFLRVPFEEAPIEFIRSHRINSSFPQPQPSRPADPGRAVDPWELWTFGQRETFVASAGPTLTKCGFAGDELIRLSSYDRLILRVQEMVGSLLPDNAYVLVVSRGDEALLNLKGRKAEHFPQGDAGAYAGHYPAASDEAIAQLERLRANGATNLVFPKSSLWWLDHYVEFRQHLERRYPVVSCDEACTIFALNAAPPIANPGDEQRSAILRADPETAISQRH